MSRQKSNLLKAAMSTLYYTGSHKLLAPLTQGVGVVFMLHHVRPDPVKEFEPNRILRITPEFLDLVLTEVRAQGFDIVTLDEAHWRLAEGEFERPFAVFTLDDGYRDNFRYALPVFRKHDAPLAVYVTSDFADGAGELWWLALEKVIAEVDEVSLKMDGELRTITCASPDEKDAAFQTIYWWLRSISEAEARRVVRELCRGIGFAPTSLCSDLVMNWDEVRAMSGDKLVTIGAHTRAHFNLAKLSYAEARDEIERGTRRIEQELGDRPRHFSYPYGQPEAAGPREFQLARELGFKTAVTTRKGVLFPEHCNHLMALPRVSLNGDYQDKRFLSVMMSGAPFALYNRFRKVNAA